MQNSSEDDKRFWELRRVILIICVFCLGSTAISCANVWIGPEVYTFPISYLLLLLATILILAKLKSGYYLLLVSAFAWAINFSDSFGWFIYFGDNPGLIFLIIIPFLLFLFLIPLTVKLLVWRKQYEKILVAVSILISLCFPAYAVFDRFDRDYRNSVYAEFRIEADNSISITCKPQPSDTRKFRLKTKSNDLLAAIKEKGTFSNGFYYESNTGVIINYRFNNPQSITLTRLDDKMINEKLTWTKDEIEGNTSFLQP